MNHIRWCSIVGLVLWVWPPGTALGADAKFNHEFARQATWKIPSAGAVREQALAWLAGNSIDVALRARAASLWVGIEMADDSHLLDLLAATFAAADPAAIELVNSCSRPRSGVALPDATWLGDEKVAPFERDNLRLFFGRWLAQESLYDEAQTQLDELKPDQVIDPATLLFYQAVVRHRSLNRDPGLKTIGVLLENEALIPKRYASIARLMQADLEGLKDESLDHIARRMDDVRRRLDLGRAGPKVRAVEDGVIASLDKLIDEVEKQQQAAAAASAKSARGTKRPTAPAQDSAPMQGKGPGEVAKKPIGNQSGWGELPPRQRQEALQQIGKDFPAHYRDVIEQYFRKLASESTENQGK